MAVLDTQVDPPTLRRVSYLDTPDLALHRRGVVLRVRLTEGVGADVVVKLRKPVLQAGELANRKLTIELDALPTAVLWSGTLKRRLQPDDAHHALRSRCAARRLLTKAQRQLLSSAAGGLDVDDLVTLGPVDVVRLSSRYAGGRIAVESWTYPDRSRVVELSAKCCPQQFPEIAAALRNLIVQRSITLSRLQTTKTRISLQCLAQHLAP